MERSARSRAVFVVSGSAVLLAVAVVAAVLLANDDDRAVRAGTRPVEVIPAVPETPAPTAPIVTVPVTAAPGTGGPSPTPGDARRLDAAGGVSDPGLPLGWLRCVNDPRGYSIGAPADWYVSFAGPPDYVCAEFDPAPFRAAAGDVFAHAVHVLPLARGSTLEDNVAHFRDPAVFRVDELREVAVGGRRAVMVAGTHLVGLFAGSDSMQYVVDGPNGPITFIGAVETTGGDPARRRQLRAHLDELVATVRFA